MGLFDTIKGAVAVLVDKLGPAVPLLLSIFRVKLNEDDREAVLALANEFDDVADAFRETANAARAAVDSESEGGKNITMAEAAEIAAKLKDIGVQVAELPARVRNL